MQRKPLSVRIEDERLLPFYASDLAAGADLRASCKDAVVMHPSTSALVPTGICLEIPSGFEVQIRPRSGLALKHCVTVLNTPGTIDADYRGEIKVLLINHGREPFTITYGMRIAQMVLAPVLQAKFSTQKALPNTARGEGGFGHTGTN
jgi:dUTP pyrophosphatase